MDKKTKSLLLELSETLADTTEVEKLKSVVSKYIKEPFKVPTPDSKIKKRPDGFDYVESSWMDNSFKSSSPLYDNNIVYVNDDGQWIDIIVKITDKITGNSELGGGSAKIQVARNTGKVLDKGNNLTAALSKAIKNAQSRFGHAADVYHKRHELPTDDEMERYKSMLAQIKNINSTRAYTFSDQWDQLGTGFGDYLDKWQIYINRHINNKSSLNEGSNNQSII